MKGGPADLGVRGISVRGSEDLAFGTCEHVPNYVSKDASLFLLWQHPWDWICFFTP